MNKEMIMEEYMSPFFSEMMIDSADTVCVTSGYDPFGGGEDFAWGNPSGDSTGGGDDFEWDN